jgi:hypothetical protein
LQTGDHVAFAAAGSSDALLYGITPSRESRLEWERLPLLNAEEWGLDTERCSMEKAAAVKASHTSGQTNPQRKLVVFCRKRFLIDFGCFCLSLACFCLSLSC